MSETVIVYHQPDCPPCHWVMEWLDRNGVSYTVKDVVADPAAMVELQGHGARSTPTVVIGNDVFIGFEREKLSKRLGLLPPTEE